VPENRERRKARMRAYGQALVALGQAHPDERRTGYEAARRDGRPPGAPSQNWSLARLREAYPAEFKRLFEEKLASEGTAPVATE
jgi:hypothetical protein